MMTSIEILEQYLHDHYVVNGRLEEAIKQAKIQHEEEIIDSFAEGEISSHKYNSDYKGKEYYDKKYNGR